MEPPARGRGRQPRQRGPRHRRPDRCCARSTSRWEWASRCCWSARSAPTASAAGRCCWPCSASSRTSAASGSPRWPWSAPRPTPDRAPHWFGALVTLRLALIGPVTLLSLGVCLAARGRHRHARRRRAGLRGPAGVGAERAQRRLPAPGPQRRGHRHRGRQRHRLGRRGRSPSPLLDGGLVAIAAAFLVVSTLTNLAYIVLALRASPVHFRRSRPLWPRCCARASPSGSAAC